jgi:hypothetical protein
VCVRVLTQLLHMCVGAACATQVPDTAYALDHMRPDMVLLMALGRALVLWDSIEPTEVCVYTNM